MATIKTKHEDGDATDVPATLAEGELAVNTQARKLWVGPIGGGTAVPLISTVGGGWTEGTDPNDLVNTNSGNVGIGTLTPDNLLEVSGPTAFTGYLRLSDTDGSGIILSDKATPTDRWTIQRRNAGASGDNGTLQFNTTSAAGGDITSVLALTDEGSVGIGNANAPDYSGWTTLAIGDTNSGNIDFFSGGSHRGSLFGTSGGMELKSSSGEATTFSIGSIDAMTIDSAGFVGIGTDSPTSKLYVNSGTAGVALTLQTSGNGSDNCNMDLRTDAAPSSGQIRIGANAADMYFKTGSTERMRIDSAGVVTGLFTGTGVTQASSKFEVVTALPAAPDANTIYFVT